MTIPGEIPPDDELLASGSLHVPATDTGVSYNSNGARGMSKLQDMVAMKLSTRQDVMYPAHGFGKGGIGTFLATGACKAGMVKLPHGKKMSKSTSSARTLSAGSATNTMRSWGSAAQSASGLMGTGVFAPRPDTTAHSSRSWQQSRGSARSGASAAGNQFCKPWEVSLPHPHDFLTAARSARIHDVPASNRWAAMSFYENDPSEIKRHLDITGQLDQLHANTKEQEHATDRARRQVWAAQQREMFRQQRQEVAIKYQTLGLPLRPSHYSVLDQADAAEAAYHEQNQGPAMTRPFSAPVHVSLPKPSFVKVYDRMSHEINESPRLKEENWRRGRESARLSREKATIGADVASLDDFEDHLQAMQRARARSQYAVPE